MVAPEVSRASSGKGAQIVRVCAGPGGGHPGDRRRPFVVHRNKIGTKSPEHEPSRSPERGTPPTPCAPPRAGVLQIVRYP